jgi:YidC/Oxa1 family membrane protein insertase
VTDWSGIAYEYAFRTKRPVLFVDTPMKVINPEWKKIGCEPTDISFRSEAGVSVAPDDTERAVRAVRDMLAEPERFAAKIERLLETNFYNPGRAGEAAGAAILDALIARRAK